MSSTTFTVDAALFDMDGTLVDSTAGVEGAWHLFKETYPDIDVRNILSSAHGVRTVDNLRNFCKLEDSELIKAEAERFETAIVETSKAEGKQGIILLPGVKEALLEIASVRSLPNPSWAICTSATRKYATAALGITGVPVPDVFVASEDVAQGKPFPDPYLLGASRCGADPKKCVVFEDAPSGILSGKAAGCKTIGFLTTHTRAQLEAAGADYIVDNMSKVTLKRLEKGLEVTVILGK